MSRPPPIPPKGPAAARLRGMIEAAIASGADPEAMTLRLTLTDTQHLSRDRSVPVADISFVGGVMRYLGVKVEKGGVGVSVLDLGGHGA